MTAQYRTFLHDRIQFGEIGRDLFVFRQDQMTNKGALLQQAVFKDLLPGGGASPEEKPFLHGYGTGFGRRDEITEFLQAMMDLAWQEGLRPTGFEAPTNELNAVRYHLEDMRKLAKVPK